MNRVSFRRPSAATLVWALVLAYIVFFSAYSIQRHATLNSYAADLSFIDQPMWNTLHGRFLERTMGDRQVSRVAEHLEPIIIPIALVFILWDDVRAILIIQTIALALGALPVYWIARRTFGPGFTAEDAESAEMNHWGDVGQGVAGLLPLAFVIAYLMFPALQAANVADFHADPFIVVPLLFAFWYATERRYWAMWVWALIAMLVKENLPTLTFMLGLYLVILPSRSRGIETSEVSKTSEVCRERRHGVALMVVSLVWFYVATFLIVAPLARQVYGTDGPVYLAHRYAGLGGGVNGFIGELLAMLRQPDRLAYLVDLLAPVGWLALLAPEYLLLGLPVLVANFISDFPGQYSGQQHYSAPLVPVFVLAAIYGARRLLDVMARGRRHPVGWLAVVAVTVWLLAWSLGYHHLRGWTPLARDFHWPRLTPHHQLLTRFTSQIPDEAGVSTTPPLHPHLAHRHQIYIYPTVADADFVLLDVAGRTDAHPSDVRSTFGDLRASGEFRLVDAADGYALLTRDGGVHADQQDLPEAFYDFARADGVQPQYPVAVEFSDSTDDQPMLRLLGYDVVDDPAWQQTSLRLYWQPLVTLPTGTHLWPFVFSDDGFLIEDTSLRPMVTPIWYPPWRWQTGEVVVTETLPWDLGPRFNLGVTILRDGSEGASGALSDPASRFVVSLTDPTAMPFHGNTWAQVGSFERVGRYLAAAKESPTLSPLDVTFAHGIQLVGYRTQPSEDGLYVVLRWLPTRPVSAGYTIFVHLVVPDGTVMAQSDSQPHWVSTWPTDRWVPNKPVLDGHRLALPSDRHPGPYQLRVGMYHWQTLERLPVLGADGRPAADYTVPGELWLE